MDKLLREIIETDFKIFLTRPYNLLTVAAHAQAYQERMRKITGFYFKSLGYLGTGNLVEILRTDEEVKQLNEKIKQIIVKRPQRFLKILKSGQKFNQVMRKMTKEMSGRQTKYRKFSQSQLLKESKILFNIYADQFVTTTVIPFRAGVVLQELINQKSSLQYKKFLSVIEKLRLVTAYVPFEKIVLGALLKEVAERTNFKDHAVLFNLTPIELKKLIQGKFPISKDKIKKRNEYYTYFRIGNKDLFLWGKGDYVKFKKLFGPKVGAVDLKMGITGSTAYPGKVIGRVKIVLTANDMAKFERGDILVSINSSPRFMEVIRKSKGIVTDEGGITCHAAIVSRELGIPCVIGTKIATKVLKDGDIVEVDAHKGIVKKIK